MRESPQTRTDTLSIICEVEVHKACNRPGARVRQDSACVFAGNPGQRLCRTWTTHLGHSRPNQLCPVHYCRSTVHIHCQVIYVSVSSLADLDEQTYRINLRKWKIRLNTVFQQELRSEHREDLQTIRPSYDSQIASSYSIDGQAYKRTNTQGHRNEQNSHVILATFLV